MTSKQSRALASRTKRISSGGALSALARANELEKQGHAIIHLEIGEPDADTPEHISAAATRSLQAGNTRYGPIAGTSGLRNAIANYIGRTRHLKPDANQVIVTPGVKGALFFTIMAILNEGEEILVPDLGFPAYATIARFAGGRPIEYSLKADTGFQLNVNKMRQLITPSTRAILVNSPANPSGIIYDKDSLAAVAQIAIENDLWVLSDEIYFQIYFTQQPPPSIYSLPGMMERTILMDGFSKAYAMTGWRLGFGVFPKELVEPIKSIMVNDHSCLPVFIQDAGEVALTADQSGVAKLRESYRQRTAFMTDTLGRVDGITPFAPQGTFYILVKFDGITEANVASFADFLLDHGVATLPASSFGKQGDGMLRLAVTQPMDVLSKAADSIATGYRAFTKNKS